MEPVKDTITRARLAELAASGFGDLIKAAVDCERRVMVVGGELHSDEEQWLIEDGSRQSDRWGINLYPVDASADWIEFDSMINVRPSLGNPSRGVEDPAIQARIREIVSERVPE
ncbi:MAG: hypothetical protein HZA61_06605 [Candidatus Eisenbacteria bacterium]|uniref:Uncharacterized protein n=1 Tax=Eiseniibacteriota bacterium TaxID=2212470 RepID=A0A933SCF5_UNCEI|nr:hypothetical protein [Candidatus Eisenbacteria bacterium]